MIQILSSAESESESSEPEAGLESNDEAEPGLEEESESESESNYEAEAEPEDEAGPELASESEPKTHEPLPVANTQPDHRCEAFPDVCYEFPYMSCVNVNRVLLAIISTRTRPNSPQWDEKVMHLLRGINGNHAAFKQVWSIQPASIQAMLGSTRLWFENTIFPTCENVANNVGFCKIGKVSFLLCLFLTNDIDADG